MEQMNYPTRKDFFNAFGKLTINEIKDGLLLRTENSHIKYNEIVKDFKRHLNLNDIRPDVDTQSQDRFLGYEEKELIPFTDDEIWLFEFDLDEHKRTSFDFIIMEDKGVNISQTKVSCKWQNDTEEFVILAYKTFKFREACKIVISQLMEQSEHPEAVKPNEVIKELHNHIFKDNAFEFWELLFENFNINETKRTDLRFMYEIMKYEGQIHKTVTVKSITDWINETYQFSIAKLQYTSIKSKSNESRMSIYNLIK